MSYNNILTIIEKQNNIIHNIKNEFNILISIQDSLTELIQNLDKDKDISNNDLSVTSSNMSDSYSDLSIFSNITDSIDAEISKNILQEINKDYNHKSSNMSDNNQDIWVPPSKPGLQNSTPII